MKTESKIITAKFSGRCTKCHGVIPSGAKCEWTRGVGVRHVNNCPASSNGSNGNAAVTVTMGVFKKDGKIYVVKPNRAKTRVYAKFLAVAREQYQARVEYLRANHTMIMSAQARKHSVERGDFFIPFGLELPVVMDELTQRLRNWGNAATVIVVAGSGITMCCLLKAALLDGKRFKDVRGISSGRPLKSICDTLKRHISAIEMSHITRCIQLVETGAYGALQIDSAWPTHPFYERKAYAWLIENIDQLEEPISFLNM